MKMRFCAIFWKIKCLSILFLPGWKPRQVWLKTSPIGKWAWNTKTSLPCYLFCLQKSWKWEDCAGDQTQLQLTNPPSPQHYLPIPVSSSALSLLQQVKHKPAQLCVQCCCSKLPTAALLLHPCAFTQHFTRCPHATQLFSSPFLARLQSLLPGSQLHCCLALSRMVFVPCLSGSCWEAGMCVLHSRINTSPCWWHGAYCASSLCILRSCLKTGILDQALWVKQTSKAHKDLRLV